MVGLAVLGATVLVALVVIGASVAARRIAASLDNRNHKRKQRK